MTTPDPARKDEPEFDVIIIGAGINGAGVARDAAMRGLKVLLLDKGDIGGGTSSLSTRLIHGGLRYLEHGEVRLVRESLRERACLLTIAPHLVRAMSLVVPVYRDARRGLWTLRAGMTAYDALSFGGRLPRHRMLSRVETLQRLPGLSREGLLGAAVYFDAQLEFAERLVLENALSAVEHGATVVTYARVENLVAEGGKVASVEFTRQVQSPKFKVQLPEYGAQSEVPHGEEGGLAPALSAHASVVINAAGPWVDELLDQTNRASSPRLIGGTKGSHIIVAPFSGAPDTAVYVEAEIDRRPFFIIPWNGNYLIGTTDIRYEGKPDHVNIDSDEIQYLLRETNRVVPQANLTRADILYTYSGVRPLPFTGDQDEQNITRRHFIRPHPEVNNLFSLVGGKLTTYRSLAEQTVDIVFRRLGRTAPACVTAQVPLPGATTSDFSDFANFSKDFRESCGLPEKTSDHLLRIYGTRASLVIELVAGDPSLSEVVDDETGAIAAEVVFSFKHELAETLTDCLLRRTMIGLNSSCGFRALDAVGTVARRHLGWSESRVNAETEGYRKEISRRRPNGQ